MFVQEILWYRVNLEKTHTSEFFRLSKQHDFEGRVLFEIFEKLVSAYFLKLHEKSCYHRLIYMKRVIQCQKR